MKTMCYSVDNSSMEQRHKIIDFARGLDLSQTYTEKHHIIPKSLGGDNSKTNLVVLTGRQHFICHW